VEREEIEKTATNLQNEYNTLSHVWGTKPPLKLTKANHEKFKISIEIEELPQCFADAVYITRRLGVHYLWIDSLWSVASPQLQI
jgi:hypothetical protein